MAGRKRTGPPKEIKKTMAAKFGIHLEQLVTASGLSVAELAELTDRTDKAVWSYFRGQSVPHINDWPKIAKALGLKSIRELVPDVAV